MYDDNVILPSQDTFCPTNQPKEKKDQFDDFDKEDSQHGIKIPVNEISLIEVDDSAIKDLDTSTPYSSLKRPVSSPLKRQAKKQKPGENCNLVRQLLREKKLSIVDNLKELEFQKIKDSIRHAQEVHEQTLRHNEERHKLELEKLNLDIAILRKSYES